MPEKAAKWWTRPDWWTVICTGVLAVFAFASFVALLIQLQDARDAFRKDQRPYLWLASDSKDTPSIRAENVTVTKGRQIVVDMRYNNWGKSPAILLRTYHGLALGSESVEHKPWTESKIIQPSGKVDFFSAVSDPLSDQQIDTFWNAQQGSGITVYATWQYLDSSANKYETDICMTRLNLNSWTFCATHNDIKDCSKETCED